MNKLKNNQAIQKLLKHKLACFGLIIFTLEVLLVIFLPIIFKLDPNSIDGNAFNKGPSMTHILGTDQTGRDMFARLVSGGRVSIFVGIVSTCLSALIGIPLGLLAGYYRGIFEVIVMRMADIFMSFPEMVLALVFAAVFSPSISIVILIIGILGWTQFARLIYGSVISVSSKDYVLAAKASGQKNRTILRKYILPNAISPIFITFTFRISEAIITESALSFLGVGVCPPQASWGNILNSAQSLLVLTQRTWMWIPAGICLILTIVSINFFGDGMREALDPKTKK